MERFTIPYDFDGIKYSFHIYIGIPCTGLHPLKYQAAWLKEERGGYVPQDVMDSFEKLHKIALENNVSFEELCVYALGNEQRKKSQGKLEDGVLREEGKPLSKWIIPGLMKGGTPPKIPEDLLDEEVVILMNGQNVSNEKVFAFLQLTLRNIRALKEAIDRDDSFMPSEFGTVLAAGTGEPSDELRAKMAAIYTESSIPNV
jgi:Domain of unknown function (DUF2610)